MDCWKMTLIRRVKFCLKINEKIEEDAMRHEGIKFSDEATLYRTGSVNRYSCHYYNTQHPDILNEENLNTNFI